MKDADGNHIDPIRNASEVGTTPTDARPLIVRLVELEAMDPDKRTTIQAEAMALWQSQIGDLAERQETVGHFIRQGGPFDRFTDYLRDCGLGDASVKIYDALYKAIEAVGWPTTEEMCNPGKDI